MSDVLEGPVVRLGDDVNTDNILHGPYLNVTDPEELGRHLLETYPGDAAERVVPGALEHEVRESRERVRAL